MRHGYLMDTLNLSRILAMKFMHLEGLNRTLMKRLVSSLYVSNNKPLNVILEKT